jgi:uncharacterized membrane protein (Fun14 family)
MIGIYYIPPSVLSSEGLVFITSHHLSYLQNDWYLLHPTICLIFRRIGIYYIPPSVLSLEGLVFITSHYLSYLQKDWYLLHPTR